MSAETASVNGLILDSVATVDTMAAGLAPPLSAGMLGTVMAETLAMQMYNAVHRQQNDGMIGSAALTATCARMLNAVPMRPAPPPPPAPVPPSVDPLPGPPQPLPPAQAIALAAAEAAFAVGVLKTEAAMGGAATVEANDALAAIATAAAVVPPTPHPAPPAA